MKGTQLTQNGLTVTLQQQAYITDNGNQYQAQAVDKNENEYIVTWGIINNETENEDQACDWNDFEISRA